VYGPWTTTQANARDRLRPDSRLDDITGDLDTPADPQAAFRGADTAYSSRRVDRRYRWEGGPAVPGPNLPP
jgi:hypothetical protein